jgi:hypothetical protein
MRSQRLATTGTLVNLTFSALTVRARGTVIQHSLLIGLFDARSSRRYRAAYGRQASFVAPQSALGPARLGYKRPTHQSPKERARADCGGSRRIVHAVGPYVLPDGSAEAHSIISRLGVVVSRRGNSVTPCSRVRCFRALPAWTERSRRL